MNAAGLSAEVCTRRTGPQLLTRAAILLAAGWMAGAPAGSQAQQELLLVNPFTHSWRYDDSGRDLGTAWRTNDFDDLAWPTGRGLFGVESTAPFPYAPAGFSAIDTPLALTPPGGNAQTITYYFRTHFLMPTGSVAGVLLRATNYLDDGAVIYLNGLEVGRLRMPSNPTFQTLALPASTEGLSEPTNLVASPLRTGENVLAVEVHQNSTTSSDVAFAMSLTALVPETLAVLASPQGRTNIDGTSAARWQADPHFINGSRTASPWQAASPTC